MVVIINDESLEDLRNGKLVKAETPIPIQAGETFGIATQKWVDKMNKEEK